MLDCNRTSAIASAFNDSRAADLTEARCNQHIQKRVRWQDGCATRTCMMLMLPDITVRSDGRSFSGATGSGRVPSADAERLKNWRHPGSSVPPHCF